MKPLRWLLPISAALAGVVLLPLVAYVVGRRLAGPYAGARGLASYFDAIYGAAGRGSPLALALLAGPLVCVLVWQLRSWLLARTGQGQ